MNKEHALQALMGLFFAAVGGVIGAAMARRRERARARRRSQLQLPSPPPPATIAPAPFGYAHSRASLAALVSALEYVRARLATLDYTMTANDGRALAWLLEALGDLPGAITGDPRLDSAAIKQRMGELDAAIGPGSWWRTSQQLDREPGSSWGAPPKLDVPAFAAIYDSVFVSELEGRPMTKRFARRVRAEAKRTGLSVPEARARLAQGFATNALQTPNGELSAHVPSNVRTSVACQPGSRGSNGKAKAFS